MNNYQFAYGDSTVTLPLEGCNILGELHGNKVEPIKDIRTALWGSLDEPIGSEALCKRVKAGNTVALIVSDMSRFWMRQDLVVPHLVDYLTQRCGVQEADISIVIANGTHEGGDEQAQRYNILLYSSIDSKDVEPMGMKAFSDVDSLLAAAQLEGKSVYVIPNGSTVIPHVKEDTEA